MKEEYDKIWRDNNLNIKGCGAICFVLIAILYLLLT